MGIEVAMQQLGQKSASSSSSEPPSVAVVIKGGGHDESFPAIGVAKRAQGAGAKGMSGADEQEIEKLKKFLQQKGL